MFENIDDLQTAIEQGETFRVKIKNSDNNHTVSYMRKNLVLDLLSKLKKEEKVIIPDFIANFIEQQKNIGSTMLEALVFIHTTDTPKNAKVSNWLYNDKDLVRKRERLFAMAYTGEYKTEVSLEPLFTVDLNGTDFLVMEADGTSYFTDYNLHNLKDTFTEEEIKAIDERYLALKQPIV